VSRTIVSPRLEWRSVARTVYERLQALVDHAALYNFLQFAISASQRSTKRWAHDWLEPRAGERILDVACGTGEFCGMGPEGDRVDYLGVDINPRYIEYARRRYRGARRAFRVADATQLDLPDGSFDKVLFANAMHHLPDEQNRKILGHIARILKPGGRLVLIDTVGDHPGRIQRFFLQRDRGDYLRSLEHQRALVEDYFDVERCASFDTGLTPQTIIAAVRRPHPPGPERASTGE